jgi:hypothetical protein
LTIGIPALFYDCLHKNKTNTCGTVRRNRKEVPKFTKKLQKGQRESKHTNNMMVIRWIDRREVCMLTTPHEDTVRPTGKADKQTKQPQKEPQCVLDYNNMGAVD